MTDPRIKVAARELKRLFSESEQANDAMWLSCAKCVLDAADVAAWRPIETAPMDTDILTHYEDGRVMVDRFPYRGMLEWQEQFDKPPTHWQPFPSPPGDEAMRRWHDTRPSEQPETLHWAPVWRGVHPDHRAYGV